MSWESNVSSGHTKPASSQLARRFWGLLIGIMAVAILASALAIWLTATPFLRNFQNNAILQKAEQRAVNIETILDQHRQILAFIASQRRVISTSIGYVDNVEILDDYTTDAALPDHLVWIGLYDAFAETLATQNIEKEHKTLFSSSEIEGLVLAVVDELPDGQDIVLLRQDGKYLDMLIAAPVFNRGFIEGALLGQLHLDLDQVFPGDDSIQSTVILNMDAETQLELQNPENVTLARVSGTSLLVSIQPNTAVIAVAGRELLINTVSAITFVLALAFGTFAWLGRTSIIAPHSKLEEQRRSLSELAAVANLANDAIMVTDLDEKVLWCNPAFQELSGYSIEEIRGRRPDEFLQGVQTSPESRAELRHSIDESTPKKIEILNYAKTGHSYWIVISITVLTDENGEAYGYMAISSDITEARRQREELIQSKNETEFQSLHDPLTGLANRRAFDAALAARRAYGVTDGTIIHIDLDHFKHLNDNMGHAAGDFALCEVAKILKSEVRSGKGERLPDLAARMGGDEFVILLSPSATIEIAKNLSRRLLDKICKPMVFETTSFQIGASFGIASTHDRLLSTDDLLAAADASLYDAKDSGRNTICCYSQSLHHDVVERRELAREFRVAISNREFEPYYQPQFDAKTGEITGAEVLARWPSERLGLLTPNVFLPIAQQLSLMQELDQILFQKASDQIMALHRKGTRIPKISFNVTAERLIGGAVHQGIRSLGEDRPQIAIEVLESVIVEEQLDIFRFEIDRLRDLGVWIEIDDFGSGHTSLVGIMELDPDVMKIDKRLILPIVTSKQARKMLKQIVGMAKTIGLAITAEGIETIEHAKIATDSGCDTLQGFGLARPMPINELEALVGKLDSETKTLQYM